jgi:hypothetical protein
MFAATPFLFGLMAIGLPIAIHLLTRQKSKVLKWGAMDFLKKSISSASSKRQRLKDRLLMMLRALAIVFLVLTFAQPLTSRYLGSGSDLDTILVWDISLSTGVQTEDGSPRQEAIRSALLQQISELPDHSSVRILLAGAELRWLRDEPVILTPNNRNSLQAEIKKQTIDQGGGNIVEAIQLALNAPAEKDDQAKSRQVILIHDLQANAWKPDEKDRWLAINRRVAQTDNLSLRIADFKAGEMQRGPQVAVIALQSDRDTLAAGSKQRFKAILRNYSDQNILDARLIWSLNGREIERSDFIELEPESDRALEYFFTIDDQGSQLLECHLKVDDDPLPADNKATLALEVTNDLPVLIIDDTKRIDKGQVLPSQFIAAALGARLPNKKDKNPPKSSSVYQPSVIASKDLNEETLEENLALIIAQTEPLKPEAFDLIKQFVAKGRGVWIMMDTREEELPEWTNDLLKALDLDSLSETTLVQSEEATKPFRLTTANTNQDYARDIAVRSLDLFRAKIDRYYQLIDRAFLDQERLLQTPDGDPVILSIPAEPGRVILQTCNLNRDSSNLPILQTFVPIMRTTLRECIGQGLTAKNLEPGQTISIQTLQKRTEDDDPLVVTRPDGSTEKMMMKEGEFRTSNTFLPGTYSVSGLKDMNEKPVTKVFTVMRSEAESNLSPVESTLATDLVTGKDFQPDKNLSSEDEGKWPLALWFAIIAGLLFLSEAFLSHRLAQRRINSSGRIDLKPVY